MADKRYITERLASFVFDLTYKDIPASVVRKAKLSLLDLLFVYVTGYHKGELSNSVLNFVQERTSHKESSIMLTDIKTNVDLCVLATSLISHSTELDDGHRYGTAHPASVIIPTAFAFGEKHNCSLESLIVSIVAGYDVMLRLSKSINPSHLKRGFHSTSSTGTIGSAITASCLMKLDKTQMTASMALAGLFSSGLQEMLHSHPSSKSLQVGHSAQSGANAAIFASLGIKGPLSLFEGKHGWINAFSDVFNENDLMSDLGSRWEIMNTYIKLYPTCRHCHSAIDLAIKAFNDGYTINNINRVLVKTYSVAYSEVAIIKKPKSVSEAMFSLSFAISIALNKGSLKIEDLQSYLNDQKTLSYSSVIEIVIDTSMDAKYPAERGCILELQSNSGEKIVFKTKLPKGEPEKSLTDDEYFQKFRSITEEYISEQHTYNLFDTILHEQQQSNIIPYINTILNKAHPSS